ncbi:MAG: FkbM family methyltransferase [Alphaproteobacteria bacterium]
MTSKNLADNSSTTNKSVTRLKDCRYGKMLFLHSDEYVGRSLDLYGEFSEGEAQIFQKLVRTNDVVVEVGANIGTHTVLLAQLVGPSGLVLAFEPQRVIFHILCANLALNDIFNVHTYLAGVGRQAGSLKVPMLDYAAAGNFGGIPLMGADIVGEVVGITPLDDLKLPSLRLLKIDVEGMEIDVLAGARQLIARHRPFLYVENDRPDNSEALITMIEELGYDLWWHLTPLFNPQNYANNANNVFEGTVSINLLCVPKEIPANIEGLRKVSGPTDWWQNPM